MSQECKTNLRSLNGCYGWIGEGTDRNKVITRAIGYFNFGPNGQLTGSYEGSFGGNQVFKTFKGTVTINANDYGKMQFIDNAGADQNFDFVIAGDGKVLYLINRDERALQTLTATKV